MNLRDVDFTPDPEEYTVKPSAEELLHYRKPLDPDGAIKDIAAYLSDVVGPRFLGVKRDNGDLMPWEKASRIGFRPGETTVWAGINGHGKSALTTQVALWWALKGRKSLIASFEMRPADTIDRMFLQAAGNSNPTEDVARDFFRATTGKVLIFDRNERTDPDYLKSVIRYSAVKLKVNHFWIDSLQKVIRGDDDYNGQKALIEDITNMARELMIHIHVIAHVRKLDDEKRLPGKFDAKGSSALSDLVDQFVTVWRNKKKEQEVGNGKEDDGSPDFMLVCDKNRHGGWEGRVPLWGDLSTWHFRGTQAPSWNRGYELQGQGS